MIDIGLEINFYPPAKKFCAREDLGEVLLGHASKKNIGF
jgi:hypothetical protein